MILIWMYIVFIIVCIHIIHDQVGFIVARDLIAPGYSIFFDGKRDHFSLISNKWVNATNFTLSIWSKYEPERRTDRNSDPNDVHIIGHFSRNGPYIFLTRRSNGSRIPTGSNPNPRSKEHNCKSFREGVINVNDGKWHHFAITGNLDFSRVYVDLNLRSECIYSGDISVGALSESVSLGMNTHTDDAHQHGFVGRIDEAAYYGVSLEKADIIRLSRGEVLNDYIESCYFHSKFNLDLIDHSGNSHKWKSGTGRSPKFEASGAKVTGSTIVARSRRSRFKKENFSLQANLETLSGENEFEVTLLNQTRINKCSSKLYTSNNQLFIASTSIKTRSIRLEVCPIFETFELFILVKGKLFEQKLTIHFVFVENKPPIGDGWGLALSCDGIDDYLFNKDFEWPLRSFKNGKYGGSPVTIEFWANTPMSHPRDSALISIGNGESVSNIHDSYQPYRKTGRFVIKAIDETGSIKASIGSISSISSGIHDHSFSWAHYAIVHDQANGTIATIYINGKPSSTISHNYMAVGQDSDDNNYSINPVLKNVRGLTVCSWPYWSHLYHKGMIDELRIWNISRTEKEINQFMYVSLTGKEEGLYAYYDFNSMNENGTIPDLSLNKYHLHAGGCAPCIKYFMGYSPIEHPKHGCQCSIHKKENISCSILSSIEPYQSECGQLVCMPSASSKQSLSYINRRVYGGHPCYYNNPDYEIQREDTWPKLVVSNAPVSHKITLMQYAYHDVSANDIQLNVSDPNIDDNNNLTIIIKKFPLDGKLHYVQDGHVIHLDHVHAQLPTGLSKVYFKPINSSGGYNVSNFSFIVTDGLLNSNEIYVWIAIYCQPGQYVDTERRECRPCPPGTFSPANTLGTQCKPCPSGSYQDGYGKRKCIHCSENEISDDGITCQPCNEIIYPNSIAIPTQGGCPVRLKEAEKDYDVIIQLNDTIDSYLPIKKHHVPYKLYISSIPSRGKLYEYNESQSSIDTLSKVPLFQPKHRNLQTISQFVSHVVEECEVPQTNFDHAVVGPPQLTTHMSHSTYAWSLCNRTHQYSYSTNSIGLQFNSKVYITDLTIFENFRPGSLKLVEAYLYEKQIWEPIWVETPEIKGEHYNLLHIQDICTPSEPTDRIRLTLQILGNGRPSEIDAVKLTGMASLDALPYLPVLNPQRRVVFRYIASSTTGNQEDGDYDGFNYRIKRCTSDGITDQTVIVRFTIQGMKTENHDPNILRIIIPILFSIFVTCSYFMYLYSQMLATRRDQLVHRIKLARNQIPQSAIVSPKDVSVGQELGRGASGVVYLGKFRGVSVAIKQLSFTRNSFDSVKVEVEREAKRMCELRHPNIVIFMGCCLEKHNPFILSQYCEHGSLYDILHNEELDLPWICRLRLAVGAIRGLLYLHGGTRPYIHRDVKSLNILVDESWTAKLADFGTLRVVEALNGISTQVDRLMTFEFGTIRWTAPELLLARQLMNKGSNDDALRFPYTEAVDIYSFGVVLWEIATRKLPYNHIHFMYAVEEAVLNGYVLELPENMQDSIPSSYAEIMYECLKWNPENRPTAAEILSVLENLLEDEEMVWDSTSDGYGRDGWSVSTRGVYRPTLVHSMNSSV